MEVQEFIDTVNTNIIQHYATHPGFVDVTFAVSRAEDVGHFVEVSGCWINTNGHYPINYDTIRIEKTDIPTWTLQKTYPGKKDA